MKNKIFGYIKDLGILLFVIFFIGLILSLLIYYFVSGNYKTDSLVYAIFYVLSASAGLVSFILLLVYEFVYKKLLELIDDLIDSDSRQIDLNDKIIDILKDYNIIIESMQKDIDWLNGKIIEVEVSCD